MWSVSDIMNICVDYYNFSFYDDKNLITLWCITGLNMLYKESGNNVSATNRSRKSIRLLENLEENSANFTENLTRSH